MDIEDLTALSSDELLIAGGWDPRYARLVRIVVVGDEALVLVDTNGDGAEVEAEFWQRGLRWEELSSTGIGGGSYSGSCGGLLWTVGRAPGRSAVRVQCRDGVREVEVDQDGYWVVTEDREPDGWYPVVVG